MISIHDQKQIQETMKAQGINPDLYGKIAKAIYKDLYQEFTDVPYLKKEIRELLASEVQYSSIEVDSVHESADKQTTKFLLKTHDEKYTECVIMRHVSGRNTLCISSQVGCPMACTFCATGKIGIIRNLTFAEMLDQVMIAIHHLAKEKMMLRNVVFMGMGEPFLNYGELKKAVEILTDQRKVNLSAKRVTVSTCGIVPSIDKFADDFPDASLAVSLHAPVDEARKKIMPVNHTYPIEKLMKSLDTYCEKTGKHIFYEYIMIAGITDRIEYADKLGELLQDRNAHVNFIPYNPGENIGEDDMKPSSPHIIELFQKRLKKYNIPTTVRVTMGDDIAAACGQLANKKSS